MEHGSQDNSTYSAVFAMLLIVLIIVIIAYNAIKKIVNDREKIHNEQIRKNIVIEGLPENESLAPGDEILYENLTDEEAAKIINQLLKSGERNLKKLKELKTEILEE